MKEYCCLYLIFFSFFVLHGYMVHSSSSKSSINASVLPGNDERTHKGIGTHSENILPPKMYLPDNQKLLPNTFKGKYEPVFNVRLFFALI